VIKKIKVIGLIPSRLKSKRLPFKPLLPINDIPLIIHTYKRAKMSKLLDDVIICCDDKKILNIARKFNAKSILTSTYHSNGTERIFEAYYKIKKKYDFIINIYGDEPLISPAHIDQVINYHFKNLDADIILPYFNIKNVGNSNIVKLVINNNKELMYLSRANIPFEFLSKTKFIKKHLSILSFKPSALEKFAKHPRTKLEIIEDIETLRALEIGLKVKTLKLKGDSFSIDVAEDYNKATLRMPSDRYFKFYKKI
jgi:3-deoxy-manno-octulosonate cytidylyltransferase (CMP-KDO synthetase)